MYQDQQSLPRQFYKEQCKEGEGGADERSVGRRESLSGEGGSLATPQEKLKAKSNGGKGLPGPWRPNGHHDYGISAGAGAWSSSME